MTPGTRGRKDPPGLWLAALRAGGETGSDRGEIEGVEAVAAERDLGRLLDRHVDDQVDVPSGVNRTSCQPPTPAIQ